ncbi:MAG: pyruvate, water dikinase regulatory protein [Sporomusaceae bacterium]|nr:pyruvate, water dikinase regulatory protein [Sporomusaceae bacterium]
MYVLSDSIGETGEIVVKAAASQFRQVRFEFRRVPYISTPEEIDEALQAAEASGAAVVYTLVTPTLKEYLERKAAEIDIPCTDIMGPVIAMLGGLVQQEATHEPGLIRRIDHDYFTRVEAIEFAVKFDDGKEPRGLLKADIVFTGVSRTSKTPLCMYMAHKGLKAANVPLVPETPLPEELFEVPKRKVFGLTIDPMQLYEIRKERLRSMKLSPNSDYANLERILAELDYAASIMRRIGCPTIDVTNKAVEETAAMIMEIYRKGEK